MSSETRGNGAVIYEVDLTVDDVIAAEFDDWLAGHVGEMLALPGFVSARIEGVDTEEAGTVRRSVRYRLESRRALNAYLQTHAARMRAHGIDRFGDAMGASRRILEPVQPAATLPVVAEAVGDFGDCSNCAERLTGQYCYQCGQRDKNRLISIWELLRDLMGDLFEVDSRVWRTLVPLMFRPGLLTREYLSGRRVHYTPPLRMYLVLSLVFFLVAGIGGSIDVGDPIIDADDPQTLAGDGNVENLTDLADRCSGIDIDTGIAWLDTPMVSGRLKDACRRLTAKGGASRFLAGLRDNVPTMMFVFLPLIALAMKLLYIGSRRYYVEHLLFFVHFQSYFYLALTLTVLTGFVPDSVPGANVVHVLFVVAISLYTPFYLFRSMRKVYGQWWIVTFAKYLVLFVAYVTSLVTTLALGAVFTALTV